MGISLKWFIDVQWCGLINQSDKSDDAAQTQMKGSQITRVMFMLHQYHSDDISACAAWCAQGFLSGSQTKPPSSISGNASTYMGCAGESVNA